MDMRDGAFQLMVTASGVGDSATFKGSPAQCMTQLIGWLSVAAVRKHRHGARVINITLTDGPLNAAEAPKSEADSIIDKMLLEAAADGSLQEIEDIDSLMQPWQRDPQWVRFATLQATQSAFESSIDEYEILWKYVQSAWPEYARNVKRRSM